MLQILSLQTGTFRIWGSENLVQFPSICLCILPFYDKNLFSNMTESLIYFPFLKTEILAFLATKQTNKTINIYETEIPKGHKIYINEDMNIVTYRHNVSIFIPYKDRILYT